MSASSTVRPNETRLFPDGHRRTCVRTEQRGIHGNMTVVYWKSETAPVVRPWRLSRWLKGDVLSVAGRNGVAR